MPATKAEQVLDALKALLGTVPNAFVERNSVLPEKVPAGGLIIVRDGDPGESEQALGGFGSTYWSDANAWCPRLTFSMMRLGSAVQTKGLGRWLCSAR
jgi:hypothetical protein